MHPYPISFALTDFKLQGKTLPKLILSVCRRTRLPWMTIKAFYVLVSRNHAEAPTQAQHHRTFLRLRLACGQVYVRSDHYDCCNTTWRG